MPTRLVRLLLALWIAAWGVLCPAGPAAAQVLPLAARDGAAQPGEAIAGGGAPLAEALRAAAAAGVSLIVIDGEGRLLSTMPAADAQSGAAGSAAQDGSAMMEAQKRIDSFLSRLETRLAALPNSLNEVRYILRATSPDGRIMTFVEVALWTMLFLAVAHVLTVRVLNRRLFRRIVVSRLRETPQGYREKIPFLVFRFFVGVLSSLVAMGIAALIGVVAMGRSEVLAIQLTITAIFAAYFATRVVSDLWRMLLSPYLSQYRIPRLSDRDARRLYRWMSIIAGYNIWTLMFATWMADFGLNDNVYALLRGALALVSVLANVAMAFVNYRAIAQAFRGGRAPGQVAWSVRVLSIAWAPLLIAYFLLGWLKLAFDLVMEQPEPIPLIAGAYGIFLATILVYGGFNYLLERYFARERAVKRLNAELAEADARDAGDTAAGSQGDGAEAQEGTALRPPVSGRPQSFEQLARHVAGLLALVAGLYALLLIWDPEDVVLDNSLVGNLLDVLVILFLGYIAYHAFRIWIDARIAEETGDTPQAELGDEGGAAASSRLGTLLPLFRGAILAVVAISVGMLALMELGVNVSPLFAGAGIVGIAVGFGAQTLVRDIFSGAFFLIDDAFRKGEYIDIGSVKGTVERISVRSMQLRHHLGALNTVPFGEIQVLTNYSRDWVIMKLPLRVTYDTDVEKVRKLIKKLGQRLLEDPEIGDQFIEPLKSQGVIEMQDSAMIIRVKFMTKPGDQWVIRKKVYQEIRELFAREGIRFAHREVTVRIADGEGEELTPRQREAVTGAVEAAMEEELDEDGAAQGVDDR